MIGLSTVRTRAWPLAAAVSLAVATGAAAVLGEGSPAIAIAPVMLSIVAVAICLAPPRRILLVVTFLALSLDTPSDAQGLFHTPLAPLGRLLSDNLNKTLPIGALKVSVLALLFGLVLAAHLWRQSRATAPMRVRDPNGRIVVGAIAISVLTLPVLAVWGALHGGNLQMVNLQGQRFLLMALLACLLARTLRGPRDVRVLAIVITAAACIKALLAFWIRQSLALPHDILEYTTTHGDSMLFTAAAALIIALLFDPARLRHRWALLPVAAVLVLGIVANARRLAWVQIVFVGITYYVMAPATHGKRTLVRLTLAATPVVLLYVAAGWGSSSPVFGPVSLLRSVVDAKSDRSTLDRDLENFNLVATFANHPLIGVGMGQPYVEAVKGDDISHAFPEYRYVPHNSVLGLWAWGGLIGFLGFWTAPMVALLAAARHHRAALTCEQRVASFVVIAAVEIYMLQCWGDMGFVDPKAIFIGGAALGVAARLATFSAPAATVALGATR